MVTAETCANADEMLYSCEKTILRKKSVFPFEKFTYLVLPRNTVMLPHRIIQFPLYYLLSGRLREVKKKRKFKT